MKFLTEEELVRLRKRVKDDPLYIEWIEEITRSVRKGPRIQKTGLATWTHYFVCSECGSGLIFDYEGDGVYVCSNCGKEHSGEPYDGGWWNYVLYMTSYSAYALSIAYKATENTEYLDIARKIILGYADNYGNYEVHGGIPYNNPGRFASQVLSDAHPIYDLAFAYGLLEDEFTEDERVHIENDLFRPAAEHQIKYHTRQIHNHEVVICASIGTIGLAIGDEKIVKYATDAEYGLKYQIDNAYLDDNLWFECSTQYHMFSLVWFMKYECLARGTKHSLFADPHYEEKLYKALVFPKNIYIGNAQTVMLNDGGGSLRHRYEIYEYAYSHFVTEELAPFLSMCYNGERRSLEALLYGPDELPSATDLPIDNYISECGSNLAVVRGSEDRMLLFKATPYGGEHDHYDRLAVSFHAFGKEISADLGTAAGYGSPIHYGYYKNTASHNTVVISGENMAPCETRVNEYRVSENSAYLDAETLAPDAFTMPDSFTIKQWSDEAYRGVRMRRIISWQDKYFIDIFAVYSDNKLKKDWTWHTAARLASDGIGEYVGNLSGEGPQSYVHDAHIYKADGVIKTEYKGDGFGLDIYSLADGLEMINAEGPGNPANDSLAYLVERSYDECPIYVNVIEAHKDSPVINAVIISRNGFHVSVEVTEKGGRQTSLDVTL